MKHHGWVSSVGFLPTDTTLTGSADRRRTVGRCRDQYGTLTEHRGQVFAVAFSPDGQTSQPRARTRPPGCGVRGSRPLGKPFEHHAEVGAVAFSSDGQSILTGSPNGEARRWEIPAKLPGDLRTIAAWVGVFTGLTRRALRVRGSMALLRDRVVQLNKLGAALTSEPARSVSPILSGPDPTARARAWMERRFGADAEAAFDEASRVDRSILRAHPGARFYLTRSLPEKAVAECRLATLLEPDNQATRWHLILALLDSGDRDTLRPVIREQLAMFGVSTDPSLANAIAWSWRCAWRHLRSSDLVATSQDRRRCAARGREVQCPEHPRCLPVPRGAVPGGDPSAG